MRIDLPDLGDDFSARPIGDGDTHTPTARGATLDVRPGVYLLTRSRTPAGSWPADSVVAGRPLGAFVAPAPSRAPTAVVHDAPAELSAGSPSTVRVDVASRNPVDSAALFIRGIGSWGRPNRLTMEREGAFGFEAEVPAEILHEGLVEYMVSVYEAGEARTFPGDEAGHPFEWDFTGRERWRVPVVAEGAPILLFDAARDLDHVLYPHPWSYVRFRTDIVAGSGPQRLALSATVEDFTPSPHHFALRTFLRESQRARLGEARAGGALHVRARATGGKSDRVEVALVERDGTAWGTRLELADSWKDFEIPVKRLRPVPLVLLPRPYPQFLPYLLKVAVTRDEPRLAELDGLQFSVDGSPFRDDDPQEAHGFEIERVVLELQP
jgi:hypothetical protein